MLIFELIQTFLVELLRALLIEAVCRHVREHLELRAARKSKQRRGLIVARIQEQNRQRLLHNLTTPDASYPHSE